MFLDLTYSNKIRHSTKIGFKTYAPNTRQPETD